jgi:hypothetical protein
VIWKSRPWLFSVRASPEGIENDYTLFPHTPEELDCCFAGLPAGLESLKIREPWPITFDFIVTREADSRSVAKSQKTARIFVTVVKDVLSLII